MSRGNYQYSSAELRWEVEPDYGLRHDKYEQERLLEKLKTQMATMMPRKTPPAPRAYRWEASLPGGTTRVTGKLVIDDGTVSEDIVRMRAYQKFKRHAELEKAAPGTMSCYHVSAQGHRVHVGYFPSPASTPSGNVHMPTASSDLERYVAVYVFADKEGQLEIDQVERPSRGFQGLEADLAIMDEIRLMPLPGNDIGDERCATGCACPLDGTDVSVTGTEMDL